MYYYLTYNCVIYVLYSSPRVYRVIFINVPTAVSDGSVKTVDNANYVCQP